MLISLWITMLLFSHSFSLDSMILGDPSCILIPIHLTQQVRLNHPHILLLFHSSESGYKKQNTKQINKPNQNEKLNSYAELLCYKSRNRIHLLHSTTLCCSSHLAINFHSSLEFHTYSPSNVWNHFAHISNFSMLPVEWMDELSVHIAMSNITRRIRFRQV